MLQPTQQFRSACDALGLALTGAELERLGRYLHLLLETNKQFNLTAVRDPDEAWMRHVLDSLSLLPFIDGPAEADTGGAAAPPASVVDVGSGAGLPGLVLAIVRPAVRFTLLEATGKKARFIELAAAELGLAHVTVVNDRAETAGRDAAYRERYDAAAARAIGPMNVLLELALPLVKVGGRVLAMKGRRAEAELREIGDALMILGGGEVAVYEALPGVSGYEDAVIVEVTKAGRTPGDYPRRPGVPKGEPL